MISFQLPQILFYILRLRITVFFQHQHVLMHFLYRDINDIDLAILTVDDVGKDFIKSCCLSPDGFIQVCLVLASYRYKNIYMYYSRCSSDNTLFARIKNVNVPQCINAMIQTINCLVSNMAFGPLLHC